MARKETYKTKITLQNDSVMAVGDTKAYYNQDNDAIYIHKGRVTEKDFGFENEPNETPDELIIIHERQHQINHQKGEHIVGLNEAYNRNVHDEVTAIIAEILEIRNKYKAAKTAEEKEACLAKFTGIGELAPYINAIKSGKVNPNSTSSKDFLNEMAFIKNTAINYRANPLNRGGMQSNGETLQWSILQKMEKMPAQTRKALPKMSEKCIKLAGLTLTLLATKT